ncbi:MAG: cell division protein FtsL [Lautropia sp.]
MIARANAVLALLLVLCALLLVTSQNRARRLSIELERAQGQMRELDVRYSQLQLEITKLAKASRIDELVRQQLKMVSLSPERTLYLKEPNR